MGALEVAQIDQIISIFWRLSQQDFLIGSFLDMRVRKESRITSTLLIWIPGRKALPSVWIFKKSPSRENSGEGEEISLVWAVLSLRYL